jgi:hypothetical protein
MDREVGLFQWSREMRKFHLSAKLALPSRAAMLAMLFALPSAPVLLSEAASALPRSCVIRTYYQTAQMQAEVGLRSSCPGVRRWGRTSRHVEVETVQLTPDGPGDGGGPGGLPCEFQTDDGQCNNLPKPR